MAGAAAAGGEIIPYPPQTVRFTNVEALATALETPGLQVLVQRSIEGYHTININQTMRDLVRVGDLLKLAYAGCKLHSCQADVADLWVGYKQVVVNAVDVSQKFVGSSLRALQIHHLALTFIGKSKVASAMAQLQKCAIHAHAMADEAGKLVEESQSLCDAARSGIKKAAADQSLSAADRKKLLADMAEAESREAELSQSIDDLAAAVEEERASERKFESKLETARKRSFVVGIVGGLAQGAAKAAPAVIGMVAAGPAGAAAAALADPLLAATTGVSDQASKTKKDLQDVRESIALKKVLAEKATDQEKKTELEGEIAVLEVKQAGLQTALHEQQGILESVQGAFQAEADEAARKADEAARRRIELQVHVRRDNAQLAKCVSLLKSQADGKDTLDRAVTSLDLAQQTLGKVAATFQHTRLFWLGVERQCNDLADQSLIEALGEDPDMIGELEDAVKESGLNWLSLGVINRDASLAIAKADSSVKLEFPTVEECQELLQRIPGEIEDGLRAEATLTDGKVEVLDDD